MLCVIFQAEARKIECEVGKENVKRKNTRKMLLKELKLYREKYKSLQAKRKYELVKIRNELTQVKHLIKLFSDRVYGEKYSHIQSVLASDPLLMLQRQLGRLELSGVGTHTA